MNGGEKRKNEREREAGALMERGSTGASIYRDEMFDSHGQNGQCASKTPARVVSRRDGVWTTLHLLERKIMTNDYGKPFRGSRNRVCGELVMVRRAATRLNEDAPLMSHVSLIVGYVGRSLGLVRFRLGESGNPS